MNKKQNCRRPHCILIYDDDWNYCQENNIKGGFCFKKGVEFIKKVQNDMPDRQHYEQSIAFLNGKISEYSDKIERLEHEIEEKKDVFEKNRPVFDETGGQK